MRFLFVSLVVFIGVFGISHTAVFGLEPGGLVTCDGVAFNEGKNAHFVSCNFCKFMAMVENVVDFLVVILILVATIMLAVTGIQMAYTAAGGSDARQILKERMTNIVIGFFLIIASWTIVDTLLKALVTDGDIRDHWKDWASSSISDLCFDPLVPGGGTVSLPKTEIEFDPDVGLGSGPDDGLRGGGVTPTGDLVIYAEHEFDSTVVDSVKYIDINFDLTVSSGHRTPEHNASVGGSRTSYHLTGRAADYTGTKIEMEKAKAWADANGAVETLIHDAGTGTHLHVAW